MPLNIDVGEPGKFPNPKFLTLDSFKKGVISITDQSRIPKDALVEANNIFLYEDGMPGPRFGVDWYGVDLGGIITGGDYYQASDATSHLVAVAGGVVKRSQDNGATWNTCTGATLDTTVRTNMHQDGGFLYLTNGIDDPIRYDGSTTLETYTLISAPTAPVASKTGLAGSTIVTYYYRAAVVNEVGFSDKSPVNTGTATADRQRSSFDTDNKITVTVPAVVGAVRYDWFTSDSATGIFYYLGSSTGTTFVDDGSYLPNPAVTAPEDNTTQGPKVEELTGIGSRMYGTRDTENKYRIWISSGTLPGAFSPAYDATYIDWQPGGKYFPIKAEDYRDGKGNPLATVWLDSADGQGAIIQVSLETVTIADISITVPSAYKLPGSRGTPAAGSVINVLNDYYYYNSQAFYNIGTRAQLQNILSTDEASANIRPSVKRISKSGESGITATYFDAKIFFSVPYGSDANNAVVVYDTERRAWLPKAFTIGFDKFLKYTDTNSSAKLLCWKNGDTRLSEISSSIQGDYGEAFVTSLITGLYPVNKNRFEFEWTEEAEVEFNNPQGSINIELLGIERSRGYKSTKTTTISPTVTDIGYDTFAYDTTNYDDTSEVPDLFSESSLKRYFTVQRELNAVQWRVTTNSLNAKYILRTLQTWGTPTFSGKPRSWRI